MHLCIKYKKNKICSDKVPSQGIIVEEGGQKLIDNTNTKAQKWKVSSVDFVSFVLSTNY